MGKRNIRRRSGRPLWSESGSFCADCDKFAFPDESLAIEKLEALKAQRNIRKQAGVHLLHIYPCPVGTSVTIPFYPVQIPDEMDS
jgi:hypothetical protein